MEVPLSVFEVAEIEVEGVWTITVHGAVDAASAPELRSAIRRALGLGPVIIDLRDVPFMDSAGLGALICGIREIRIRGGSAALCVRKGAVMRLLGVTGFDRIIPTATSLSEARDQVAADPAAVR